MENPFDRGYFTTDYLRTLGFKHIGENVRIEKSATIVGLKNISIGNNVRIDGNITIAAISGHLNIGDHIHIGGGGHITCAGGVDLEDFSNISQGVRIYSGSDDYTGASLTNSTIPAKYLNTHVAPVRICRHVILGSGTVVLPGAVLAEGSAVGALSLVNRSLDAWSIYAGIPVKKIRERSKDLLRMEADYLNEYSKN